MLWLVGLSAGLIDDLLLLPQDYRSSSPGGEGNSSGHSGERRREEERGDREKGIEGWGGGVGTKMEGEIGEGRWEESRGKWERERD